MQIFYANTTKSVSNKFKPDVLVLQTYSSRKSPEKMNEYDSTIDKIFQLFCRNTPRD